MEVKAETQTIKANLESPTRPKIRRKSSAGEPTMTIHTKEAHNDILDIFNQPLRSVRPIGEAPEIEDEEDEYDADDYTCTSAGESTGTGRISSATSEAGDLDGDVTQTRNATMTSDLIDAKSDLTEARSDITDAKSASEWSDFTRSKHVPKLDHLKDSTETGIVGGESVFKAPHEASPPRHGGLLIAPASPSPTEDPKTLFLPSPPVDYEAPTGPYRDPEQVAQSRLPFMTPIVEKTESSFPFASRTPAVPSTQSPATPLRDLHVQPPTAELEGLLIHSPTAEPEDLLLQSPLHDTADDDDM